MLMAKFGDAALIAVQLIVEHGTYPPIAWQQATNAVFGKGSSQADKGCPKGAFLGLCEEGLVEGVACGNYTNSVLNKGYAVTAVHLLRTKPELEENTSELWREVAGSGKTHNNQMTVVLALLRAGRIASI